MKISTHILTLAFAVTMVFPQLLHAQSYNKLMKQKKFSDALVYLTNEIKEKPSSKKRIKNLGKNFVEVMDSLRVHDDYLKNVTSIFVGEPTAFSCDDLLEDFKNLQYCRENLSSLGIEEVKVSKKQIVPIVIPDFTKEIAAITARRDQMYEATAEMHYQEGLSHMQSTGIDQNKAAAREFKRAMAFFPAYKDCQLKYEEARKAGTKRIIILPFGNRTNLDYLGGIGDMAGDRIISQLANDPETMEFLEIITTAEIQPALSELGQNYGSELNSYTARQLAEKLGAHEVWTGRFLQVIAPNPERTVSDIRIVKTSVKVGEETYTNSKGKQKTRNVYGDVTAAIRDYTENYQTIIKGSYTVITSDPNIQPVPREFTYRNNYSTDWNVFIRGDQRAYKAHINHKETIPPMASRVDNLVLISAENISGLIRKDVVEYEIPLITIARP
ncbi:MAG: hypothetical protein AAFQ83_16955 [Bacteroidota bacterium]